MAGGTPPMTATATQTATHVRPLATADHKRIARQLLIVCTAFFGISGVLALLMRAELAAPGLQVLSTQHYDEAFTLHGSGMVYLVMTPLALTLGIYLVPLQVGAAGLAWSRLAQFGLWALVCGGVTMFAGLLTDNGAAAAGWTGFLPLTDRTHSPAVGVDLWAVGVAMATLSAISLAAPVLVTILRDRAPGMSMLRLPVFCWTMLVTCLMVVSAFPALLIGMGMVLASRHLGVADDAVAYQYLFWFYGHPAVYVMFFPFLGAVAEVVSTFSGRRFFGYRAFVASILVFAALSMSVWGHHMFTTGQVANGYFSITSTALAVTAGVEYLDLVGTMWRGSIRLTAAMLFALGFMLQFLIGGISGLIVASPPLDYHLNDSYFVVAHFHYTLFAGSLFGGLAGLYYWFPKLTGRRLDERLGRLHVALAVIGTNLTFFPMFLLGQDGMPRRIADYPRSSGWQGWNEVSTAGAAVIAASFLVFAANLAVAYIRRPDAPADPWGGNTLEWWTASPPPPHNFDSLPAITSPAPLLDLRSAP